MRKMSSFLFDLLSFYLLLVADKGGRRIRAEKERLGFACLGEWGGENMGGMGWVDVKGTYNVRRNVYALPTSLQDCLFPLENM